MHGVNLLRWLARPTIIDGPPAPPGENPYWLHWLDDGADTSAWTTFINHNSKASSFIAFKPVSFDGQLFRTMIVDGPHVGAVVRARSDPAIPLLSRSIRTFLNSRRCRQCMPPILYGSRYPPGAIIRFSAIVPFAGDSDLLRCQ